MLGTTHNIAKIIIVVNSLKMIKWQIIPKFQLLYFQSISC